MNTWSTLRRRVRGIGRRRPLWTGRWAAIVAIGVTVAQLLGRAAVAQTTAPATSERDAVPIAAEPKTGTDWVRVRYDENGKPAALETAIVRYVPAPAGAEEPALTVDLVGAVHVADAAYYAELNRRFDDYDAILYELVAPAGTVVPRGEGSSNAHPLAMLQNGMKSLLALEHQLAQIDYTKKNFVHADMSPDDFLKAMKDRNQDFLQMYLQLLAHAMAQQEPAAEGDSDEEPAEVQLMAALMSEDRPRRLKMLLAPELAKTESLLLGLGGAEGSVLISDRNKVAMDVLKQQLAAGKKRLAIFYGAGHLSDMDQRLREQFGLVPVEITWLTAWDLAPPR